MSLGQDDLLIETRKLLNALNAENADLKARNRALVQKAREAEEVALEARRSERDLERDSKQLNFSLMQQVQQKTDEAKAALAREEQAQAKAKEAIRAMEACQDRLADVEARYKIAQERIKMTEQTLQNSRMGDSRHEEELNRIRTEMTSTLTADRERARVEIQQLTNRLSSLSEHNERLEQRGVELEALVETRKNEMDKLQNVHALEVARLRSAAQRTIDAESEAAYAHDQLLAIADQMLGEYDVYIDVVRKSIRGVQEQDATVSSALQIVQSAKSLYSQLKESDSCLEEIVRSSAADARIAATDGQSALERLRRELMEARLDARNIKEAQEEATRQHSFVVTELETTRRKLAESKAALEEQTRFGNEARAQLEKMELSLETTKRELRESRDAAARITRQLQEGEEALRAERHEHEEQVHQLERRMGSMTEEQHREMCARSNEIVALREENALLRRQLHSHSASLAAELQRLQGSIHQPEASLFPASGTLPDHRGPSHRSTSYSLTQIGRPTQRSPSPYPVDLSPTRQVDGKAHAARSLAQKILSHVQLEPVH